MTRTASFFCTLLFGAGVSSLGVASAHATVLSGSSLAFGESVSAGIAAAGGPVPLVSAVAPGPYDTASELLSANVPGVLSTGVLTANIHSDVDGGTGPKTTSAFATTNNLALSLGSLTLGITSISSQASISGDYGTLGATGGTSVSGLTINGVPIVTITLPANDVLLSAPGVTITLNEQVAAGDGIGSRSLQVRGLDVALSGFSDGANLLSGDIVIAESEVGEAAQTARPVPEPAGLAILGFSVGALALMRRRRAGSTPVVPAVAASLRQGPAGRLFSQLRRSSHCGAGGRVRGPGSDPILPGPR